MLRIKKCNFIFYNEYKYLYTMYSQIKVAWTPDGSTSWGIILMQSWVLYCLYVSIKQALYCSKTYFQGISTAWRLFLNTQKYSSVFVSEIHRFTHLNVLF